MSRPDRSPALLALALGVAAAAACGGDGAVPADAGVDADADPDVGAAQDIRSTAVALDLAALSGHAVLEVAPASGAGEVRLDAAGLAIDAVTVDGVAAPDARVEDGVLLVPTPAGGATVSIAVDYAFEARPGTGFDGWMPSSGLSFLWPTFCDNLFPCDEDPADGSSFELAVSGVEGDAVAVFPTAIPAPVPSYVPALAVGDYTELALGETEAGTAVSVFHLPDEAADAEAGTAHLVAAIDFLERTYGAYRFGAAIASVSAPWGPGAVGGMEHHPFFHVASGELDNEEVHAHEAAHGWYGDGVRIACWEDFVLSEGTTSYLAAHALAEVGGPDLWPGYVAELTALCGSAANTTALPDSCGVIELIEHPLWSGVPYMKGACFFEEVADQIGEATLDEVLADFYADHADQPARMDELIDQLAAAAGSDGAAIDALADEWLRTEACPADYAARCSE